MSSSEYLFIKCSLPPDEVAAHLARAVDMEVRSGGDGIFLGRPLSDWENGEFGGELRQNDISVADPAPDEIQAFDGYSLVFQMWMTTGADNEQVDLAWEVMRKMVSAYSWPSLLVHDLDLLVVGWDPVRGWRKFPPGITVDVEDMEYWR